MRIVFRPVLLAAALATVPGAPATAALTTPVSAASTTVQAALPAASADLLHRAATLNAGLKSSIASIHVGVRLQSFPFLSTALDGSSYYERPDKQAVVFDSVPALAAEFKKVYPKLDPPAAWPALYRISVLGDANGATTFRLVPLHGGRVARLDVVVDDRAATVGGYTWTYVDGGSVAFTQTFATRDGNALVVAQAGRVDLPAYKADVTSTFTNYRLNVPVPSDVFGVR